MVKLVKRLHVFILVAVLCMGVFGLTSSAAAADNTVGIVDFQLLMSQHPDMAQAKATLKAEMDQAQKDFDEKAKTMKTTEEKDAYHNKLQQELNDRQSALFAAIQDKVIAVIKDVADAKGLTVVVDKGAAVYGGQDLTIEVGKIITGNK